jgi:hypothetical protein
MRGLLSGIIGIFLFHEKIGCDKKSLSILSVNVVLSKRYSGYCIDNDCLKAGILLEIVFSSIF